MDNLNFEDDFDQDNSLLDKLLNNKGKIGAALGVLGTLTVGAYLYFSYLESYEEVPVIEDTTTAKIKPEEPGGMEVPNQDKTIYDSFSGDDEEAEEEKILDKPEEPISPKDKSNKSASSEESSSKADKNTSSGSSNKGAKEDSEAAKAKNSGNKATNSSAPESKSDESSDKSSSKSVASQDNTNSSQSAEGSSSSQAKEENSSKQNKTSSLKDIDKTKESKSTSSKESSKASSGGAISKTKSSSDKKSKISSEKASSQASKQFYRVQVISLHSEAEVNKYLARLKSKYGDLISRHKAVITQRNIPEKGRFYRLQIGEFNNFKQAHELCRKLKQKNFRCIVIKS